MIDRSRSTASLDSDVRQAANRHWQEERPPGAGIDRPVARVADADGARPFVTTQRRRTMAAAKNAMAKKAMPGKTWASSNLLARGPLQ
jgi:hypothetical protein